MPRLLQIVLHLGGAVLLFGTVLPVSQIVIAEIPVVVGVGLRVGIAATVFAPLLWRRRAEWLRFTPRELLLVGWLALSLVAVSSLMLCSARFAPCAASCTVTSLTPVLTAAGAVLFLRERPQWLHLAWLLAGAAWTVMLQWACIGWPDGSQNTLSTLAGVALMFLAVCCEAAGTLLASVAMRTVSPLTLAAGSTTLAALALVPAAAVEAAAVDWAAVSGPAWLAALWWGAGGLAAGTWLWYRGVRLTTGTVAAGYLSLLPLVSLGLATLVLSGGR
jgi:drug/metabolite transporter (DMT)-like permease